MKNISVQNEELTNIYPENFSMPWEIYKFLQQEQEKDHSHFWVTHTSLVSWVNDCLLGQASAKDMSRPLSVSDQQRLYEYMPELFQRFNDWLMIVRSSLEMKPCVATSTEGFVFNSLTGLYPGTNKAVVENLYLMNFFCRHEDNLPFVAFINNADDIEKTFVVNVGRELQKKEVFSALKKEIFKEHEKESWEENVFYSDTKLFSYAAQKKEALPLINSFLFDVPKIIQKHVFSTLLRHGYGIATSQSEQMPISHYEKLPLHFAQTDNTIRAFSVGKDSRLQELVTDQEALDLVLHFDAGGHGVSHVIRPYTPTAAEVAALRARTQEKGYWEKKYEEVSLLEVHVPRTLPLQVSDPVVTPVETPEPQPRPSRKPRL